jgi:hypothetical protein
MPPTKFRFIKPSSFRGEDFYKLTNVCFFKVSGSCVQLIINSNLIRFFSLSILTTFFCSDCIWSIIFLIWFAFPISAKEAFVWWTGVSSDISMTILPSLISMGPRLCLGYQSSSSQVRSCTLFSSSFDDLLCWLFTYTL